MIFYSVLALGIGELLDRLDGVVKQHFLPTAEVGLRPVAIDTLDAGDAVLGDFFEKAFDDGCGGVIRIDQNSEVLMLAGGVGFAGHGASLLGDGSTLLRMVASRHSPTVDPLTWLTHRPG